MKFCDKRIQNHLLNGGKIKNNTFEGSYIIYIGNNSIIRKDNGEWYTIKGQDLYSEKWEIVEPDYNWDKIIKDKVLCEFSDDEDFKDDEKVISILTSIDEYRGFYYNSQGFRYKYCKPFNQSEYINVDEDLKEYKK